MTEALLTKEELEGRTGLLVALTRLWTEVRRFEWIAGVAATVAIAVIGWLVLQTLQLGEKVNAVQTQVARLDERTVAMQQDLVEIKSDLRDGLTQLQGLALAIARIEEKFASTLEPMPGLANSVSVTPDQLEAVNAALRAIGLPDAAKIWVWNGDLNRDPTIIQSTNN
jgi:type VI protein secretion system component VasK